MSETQVSAGHVVAGRYCLVKRLGEGGMGAVWLADHVTLRSQVAIKLLHRTVLDSEDGLKRFLREAQAAAMLRSPHVVQILDHGVDEGVPYIAMELLEGQSLAARLARVSTLSLSQTARLVTHVARAMSKAHDAGIVHRDLKPDNVFLVHNDDEEVVKVLDFGIAKMEPALAEPADKATTREGALLGTPYYMSPEQVRGYGVSFRSDLWSLAMIAFECVCGQVPFEGRTVGDLLVAICAEPLPVPSTLRPLPPAFDAWFARAAAREPEARFQSAKEMAEALRAIVGDEPRPALSFSPPPPGQEAEPRPSHDTARLPSDTPPSHDAPTLDAAAEAGISARALTMGEPPNPPPRAITAGTPAETPGTPNPNAARADLGNARTVGAGSTMSGSSTSPGSVAPPARKAPRVLAAVVVAAALGVAAWLALAGPRGSGTVGSSSEAQKPAVSSHTHPPETPRPLVPAPSATEAPTALAGAPSASSTAAAASPTASASARVAAPSARAPASASPRIKQPAKSDVLAF